jgi:N-methylhydantoinase B/oxoprolinase/acetone carboxylase alpha subunit
MNTSAVLKEMLNAGSASFGASWSEIKDYAEVEFRAILSRLKDIARAVADPNNMVTLSSARHLVKAQIALAAQAIVGFTTMTIVAVQKAINAVLKTVKGTINSALSIAIL